MSDESTAMAAFIENVVRLNGEISFEELIFACGPAAAGDRLLVADKARIGDGWQTMTNYMLVEDVSSVFCKAFIAASQNLQMWQDDSGKRTITWAECGCRECGCR